MRPVERDGLTPQDSIKRHAVPLHLREVSGLPLSDIDAFDGPLYLGDELFGRLGTVLRVQQTPFAPNHAPTRNSVG